MLETTPSRIEQEKESAFDQTKAQLEALEKRVETLEEEQE